VFLCPSGVMIVTASLEFVDKEVFVGEPSSGGPRLGERSVRFARRGLMKIGRALRESRCTRRVVGRPHVRIEAAVVSLGGIVDPGACVVTMSDGVLAAVSREMVVDSVCGKGNTCVVLPQVVDPRWLSSI